jgi:hypothetical protein
MKVRRLTFENSPEGARRASLIYQGFLVGGNVVNGQRTKGQDVIRREAQVIRKFRKIGSETEDGSGLTMRSDAESFTIEFDVPQFDMLFKYVESTPWATRLSVEIEDILDWLSTLPIEESDG